MHYTTTYTSPLGQILLAADEIGLTGLWFSGEKFYAQNLSPDHEKGDLPLLTTAKKWLDIYFSGKEPDFLPPIHFIGSDFQKSVWQILQTIPYGEVTTYGAIAKQLAHQRGCRRMSAQAVGGAVGHNQISIIVPCHRVIGANGNLTGYARGIDKKRRLLQYEGVDVNDFFIPKYSTAP